MAAIRKQLNSRRTGLCILILLGVFALGAVMYAVRPHKDFLPVTIKVVSENTAEEIKPWHSDDGKWYFFLPPYAQMESTYLVPKRSGCRFQDAPLTEEKTLESIAFGEEYRVEQHSASADFGATVIFLKSGNVPTMFIRTASGTMDIVTAKKGNKEFAVIQLLDASGEPDYIGTGEDTIKGRGNSTWELDKKPFKLTLSEAAGLLGMERSANWVLLSNGFDETNLRNKLVYDFASAVNTEWTPHCEFVDVYLNGEYNGLYLLSERVEVSENRLTADREDFVFEGILPEKVQKQDVSFHISDDQYFRMAYPDGCKKEKLNAIRQAVSRLDEEIRTGSLERIDLDSWVRRFLIDEVFINTDAIQLSSFYRYDADLDRFFAGPIWDFDLSLGNDASPFTTESRNPEQILGLKRYWYADLYRNAQFYERAKQVYLEEYLPLLERMLTEEIPNLTEKTADARLCNSIRWDGMFKQSYSEDAEPEERLSGLSEFLKKRLSYLDLVWGSGKDYAVAEWYAEDKVTLPVTENTELCLPSESTDYLQTEERSGIGQLVQWVMMNKSLTLTIMLCSAFVFLLLILIGVDVKNQGRRKK